MYIRFSFLLYVAMKLLDVKSGMECLTVEMFIKLYGVENNHRFSVVIHSEVT